MWVVEIFASARSDGGVLIVNDCGVVIILKSISLTKYKTLGNPNSFSYDRRNEKNLKFCEFNGLLRKF